MNVTRPKDFLNFLPLDTEVSTFIVFNDFPHKNKNIADKEFIN